MSNLILCFSKILKIFNLYSRKAGGFFYLKTEKACPSEALVPFTVSALELRERKACWKQTGSNVSVLLNKVSVLEHDQFNQVLLNTVLWLFANN